MVDGPSRSSTSSLRRQGVDRWTMDNRILLVAVLLKGKRRKRRSSEWNLMIDDEVFMAFLGRFFQSNVLCSFLPHLDLHIPLQPNDHIPSVSILQPREPIRALASRYIALSPRLDELNKLNVEFQ
jgi:hypothetical protein